MIAALEAIYSAIQFIETHLKDDITVADIAAASGYSLYHFIRTFNQITDHTPYDYLIRRRLSAAEGELRRGRRRVLDIAADYQFNSHETFSRAFKRMYGAAPSLWRQCSPADPSKSLPAFTPQYLAHINQTAIRQPQKVERQPTRLVGLMAPSRSQRFEIWQQITSHLERQSPTRKVPGFYGISSQNLADNPNPVYFLGFASHETGYPPFVIQNLPAGVYAAFQHQGGEASYPQSLTYIYQSWLAQSDQASRLPVQIEYFAADLDEPNPQEWQILIPLIENQKETAP